MFNSVVISGTIISELIKKETPKGARYVNFQLQTVNDFNNKATNIPVVAWNESASKLLNFATRGTQLIVRGVIVQHRSYNTSRFDVSAESIVFLDTRDERFEELSELQRKADEKNQKKLKARTEAFLDAESARLEVENNGGTN